MSYAPYYCEENIYHLAMDRSRDDDWVVMISNAGRHVALAGQRAGHGDHRIVVWDYHVILVGTSAGPGRGRASAGESAGGSTATGGVLSGAAVFDLDSMLGPEVDGAEYVHSTLPAALYRDHPDLTPRFSLVRAAVYLDRFSSDRSHMRRQNGTYMHPPPAWPAIYDPGKGNTLFDLIDGADPGVDRLASLPEFLEWCGGTRSPDDGR